MLARGVKAPLDAKPLDQLVEAERAANHADRAEDRGRIADDLVGGASDHVAPGGHDIFGKRDHAALLLGGEITDAAVDQMRLHRRAAGRIDDERDRGRLAHGKGALKRTRQRRQREARLERRREADHAGQPHHRHHCGIATQPARQQRPQPLARGGK